MRFQKFFLGSHYLSATRPARVTALWLFALCGGALGCLVSKKQVSALINKPVHFMCSILVRLGNSSPYLLHDARADQLSPCVMGQLGCDGSLQMMHTGPMLLVSHALCVHRRPLNTFKLCLTKFQSQNSACMLCICKT